MPFPQVGEQAPDFTVLTDAGTPLTLSALRGRRIILYFYPAADTPGCTKQACSIRDRYAQFTQHDVLVLGASPDTVETQAAFKAKYALPFTLLADADHAVSALYGLWGDHVVPYNGQQFTTHGTRRSTFIIEADGTVSYAAFGVDPTTNPAELIAILDGAPAAHEGDRS
jgi:peroxiredoxin Q/BCP